MTILGKIREVLNFPSIDTMEDCNFFPEITASMYGNRYGRGEQVFDGSSDAGTLQIEADGLSFDHATLRQNVRNTVHTSSSASKLINTMVEAVIDTGMRVSFEPLVSQLGVSDEAAREWALDASDKFHAFFSGKQCSINHQDTGYQLQSFAHRQFKRDNDVFMRFYYDMEDEMSPLKIGFIDPNQIRGEAVTSTLGFNNYMDDGIVRNMRGIETAYKVWEWDGTTYKDKTIPAKASSGLPLITHIYRSEYSGQKRGIPFMAAQCSDLQKIAAWVTHELEKADVQSKIGLIAESKNGEVPSDVLNGVLKNQYSGPRAVMQETSAATQEATGVTRERVKEVSMPAGSAYVFISDPGTKLSPFGSTSPTSGFDKFYDSLLTMISSSFGVPVEVLHSKFSASYSASRATLLLWWKSVMIDRYNHQVDFMVPIVDAWLHTQIALKNIKAPGWLNVKQRQAWSNFTLIGSKMPDIDPVKTLQGTQLELEMGLTTFEKAAWQNNGSRYDENAARLKKESINLTIMPWHKNFILAKTAEEQSGQEEAGSVRDEEQEDNSVSE